MKRPPAARILLFILLLLSRAVASYSDPLRISVLYFSNTGEDPDLEWMQKGLADMLLTDLSISDGIDAVEREELEKIIKEQKFSVSGMAAEDQSIEIGRLLSAELLVTGSFIESGGSLRIDCKLLETETGRLKAAVKAQGRTDEIFALEQRLALGLFEGLSLEPPEDLNPEAKADAAEAYYRGLLSFDRGEYEKAIEFYKAAAAADPGYGKPREGLEASYRFLRDFRKMRMQRELNDLLAKASVLRARLSREPWTTYADFVTESYRNGITDSEQLNRRAGELGLFSGDSPAVCAWNLQTTLMEIASSASENFDDKELADWSYNEIIGIAGNARSDFAEDPFLPELIYQQLLVLYYRENYGQVMAVCEELMLSFPDYRMMWAVEDFYERALGEIGAE